MKNFITLIKGQTPITGKTVEVYKYKSSSPYYGDKIGTMTDKGNGVYEIDMAEDQKVTILVDGNRIDELTGIKFNGENFGNTKFYKKSFYSFISVDPKASGNANWGANGYYDQNSQKYYFTFVTEKDSSGNTASTNWVFTMTPDGEISPIYEGVKSVIGNTDTNHCGAVIMVADNGNIIMAMDKGGTGDTHNQGIRIAVSQTPYDISTMQQTVDALTDGTNIVYASYPEFHKFPNGRILLTARIPLASPHYADVAWYSDDNGITWNYIGEFANMGSPNWAYKQHQMLNLKNDGYFYISLARYTGTIFYDSIYIMRTKDGITWESWDGNYSKNVQTQGAFSMSELQTYCQIYTLRTNVNNIYRYTLAIDENGILWQDAEEFNSDGTMTTIVIKCDPSDGSKTIYEIDLLKNYSNADNEPERIFYFIPYKGDTLDAIVLGWQTTAGTQNKIKLYRTFDLKRWYEEELLTVQSGKSYYPTLRLTPKTDDMSQMVLLSFEATSGDWHQTADLVLVIFER